MGRKKTPLEPVEKIPLARIGVDPGGHARHGEDEIEELVHSLMARGLQRPILVYRAKTGAAPRLVVGMRRLLAAQRLGWREIDCLVLDGAFRREVAVIEEMQQGRADPWLLADALHRLKAERNWTQAHLGTAVGRTRDFIANILALTQISPAARERIHNHPGGAELTLRHLRYVARTPAARQVEAATHILSGHVSTTALEREKKGATPAPAEESFFRVRALRKRGSPQFPKSAKDWRRYSRQLNTDLRGIARKERAETRRAREAIGEARLRQRLVKKAANRLRRELGRELKLALKQLARLGDL